MIKRASRVGKEKIIDIAEALFTERGYNAVSIRDIAERCDVTNAALYYYFPSKTALFDEVLEHHASRLDARMRKAGDLGGSYRERTRAMLMEYVSITKNRRPPFYLLRRKIEGLDESKRTDYFRRLFHAMILPLEELLNETIQAGDLEELPDGYSAAALLVGMVNGQILFSHACGSDLVESDKVEKLVNIFWHGLGT